MPDYGDTIEFQEPLPKGKGPVAKLLPEQPSIDYADGHVNGVIVNIDHFKKLLTDRTCYVANPFPDPLENHGYLGIIWKIPKTAIDESFIIFIPEQQQPSIRDTSTIRGMLAAYHQGMVWHAGVDLRFGFGKSIMPGEVISPQSSPELITGLKKTLEISDDQELLGFPMTIHSQ